jgi:phosphoenolpyruvate carboxykinase (GTP)
MGDYFGHWLKIGSTAPVKTHLPKIFNVNWFRKGADGKFLWPGYGDNIRVLKWIFGRVEGTADAVETPIGHVPSRDAIDITGLHGIESNLDEVLKVDKTEWLQECELIADHQAIFGSRLPEEMKIQLEKLKSHFNR